MNALSLQKLSSENVGFGKNPIELLVMAEMNRQQIESAKQKRDAEMAQALLRNKAAQFVESRFGEIGIHGGVPTFNHDCTESRWQGEWTIAGHRVHFLLGVTCHPLGDGGYYPAAMLHLSPSPIGNDLSDLHSKAVENTTEAVRLIAQFVKELTHDPA